MQQAFLFIDGIHADKSSKRQMRRHVMRGKNAGRILHRPSKLRQPSLRKVSKYCAEAEDGDTVSNFNVTTLTHHKKFGDFSARWLPVQVSLESIRIMHDFFCFTSDRIYSPELGISLEDAKMLWLPSMFSDESSYYCSIDMMHTCNLLILHGCENIDALCGLSRTFKHVKKRLESDMALSDPSIYMLMTLIMQEQIRQQGDAVKIHAEGLKKIVELRGGLSALEKDPGVAIKVCKTDIVLALQQGDAPAYFRNNLAKVERKLDTMGLFLNRATSVPPACYYDLNLHLREVFDDMTALCDLLNHNIKPASMDLVMYQEILLSIFYRLLRFRSLNQALETFDENSLVHLGLVLCTMTVLLHHGTRTVIDFHLVSDCLECVLDSVTEQHDTELVLWLLSMGGIWTSGAEWVVDRIKSQAGSLASARWNVVHERLTKLPWINVLHDKAGQSFWDKLNTCK